MSRTHRSTSKKRNIVPNTGSSRNAPPYVTRDTDEEDAYGGTDRMEPMQLRGQGKGMVTAASSGQVTETTVPNFLLKLWKLVEDKNYDFCISWDKSGSSFHVWEPYTFSRDVLPLFFKHSNLNSFIRQLNMYGFRKVTNLEQGALKHPANDADSLEFHHQYFIRGRPELLQFIKRKSPGGSKPAAGEIAGISQHDASIRTLGQALDEIRHLREKQQGMDAKLNVVKRENQTLWREIACVRQMHMKQQQVVNKMLQFLMTFAQPTVGGHLGKRKVLPIGSDGIGQQNGTGLDPSLKRRRTGSSDPVDIIESLEQELQNSPRVLQSPVGSSLPHLVRDGGLTISDITEESEPVHTSENTLLLDDVLIGGYPAPASLNNEANAVNPVAQGIQQSTIAGNSTVSPDMPVLSTQQDAFLQQPPATLAWQQLGGSLPSSSNTDAGTTTDTAFGDIVSKPQDIALEWKKPEFNEYVDDVQADLDTLKDFLLSDDLELDTTLINDLFPSPENTLMDAEGTSQMQPTGQGDIMGNELQVYKRPELLVDFDFGSKNANDQVAPAPPQNTTQTAGNAAVDVNDTLPTTFADFDPEPLFALEQQAPFINTSADHFVSSAAPVQSPLRTPLISPSVTASQSTQSRRGHSESNSQRPPALPQGQNGSTIFAQSSAADDLLRSTLSKARGGKKR